MTAAAFSAVGSALAGGTRTTSSVPVPPGVASGQIVLVHLHIEVSSAVTPPAGFLELSFSPAPQTSSPLIMQRVWWKRASGADSGTYSFTHASAWTSGAATSYTGAIASGTPVEVLASAQRSSSGTVTPTVSATTAGGDRLLVYSANNFNSTDWTAPTGFTEVFDSPGDELFVAVKAQAAAGSTGPLASSSTSAGVQAVTLVALVPVSVSGDTTAPTVPTGLTATATGPSSISLSWTASTDDVAVTGYTVKRGGSTIATGVTTTSYGDSGLSASTLYSYTVSAQDAAGNSSADSTSASATTSAAAPASLSVTPTVEAGNEPPRIRLNVADTRTTQATEVTVVRLDPDGRITPVRTFDGNPLPLSASGGSHVGLVYDYEAPLGVPVSYATLEAPGTVSFEVTVDSESAWLIHPGVPELSRRILVSDIGSRTRRVSQGILYPMGRSSPVIQTDGARKLPEFTLSILTQSFDEVEYIDALTFDTSVLLLNVPASKGWGISAEYVGIGDMTEGRPVRFLGEVCRVWELPCTVVDRPVGGTQAERTLTDLLVYPTLAALAAAYPTLADLQAGP